jgi:23S rRNA pseudouridine1911/1915/1917 synthase
VIRRETIPAALAGERIDRAVALITGWTRAEVSDLVDAGAVLIGGRPVRSRARRVGAGEVLEIAASPPETPPLLPGDDRVPVPVIYQDDDVLVVDKPAGVVVHPGAGQPQGTLAHGLAARYPDIAALGGDRPGIVHRLDKGTSGLLVVARTAAARDRLIAQLAARGVERRYTALVRGIIASDSGLIDAPLARSQRDRTTMAVRAGGREARTRYVVERRFTQPFEATLLDCRLETGRTHQIRAHLAAIGHPVVGDSRYGDRRSGGQGGAPRLAAGRQFLHARRLAFDHPVTGQRLEFEVPLPADLAAMLEVIG